MPRFSGVTVWAAFASWNAFAQPPIPVIQVETFPPAVSTQGPIPQYPAGAFAPAYLGNGLIGIRPNPNPLIQAKTVAAGFVYSHPSGGFETFSPAPYPLGLDIRLGDSSLLRDADRVKVLAQSLDMKNGELTTSIEFTADKDIVLDLEVVQFLSRSVPSILCQEVRIAASADTTVELRPQIMLAAIPGRSSVVAVPRALVDQAVAVESDRGSKVGAALFIPAQDGLTRQQPGIFELALHRREARQFRIIAAIVTSAYDRAPDLEAIRLASWGGMLGFDELRRQNRRAWDELWQSRVKVSGDDAAQRALDAAFFYLHSSAHASAITGVPPFGLSQWSDYFGHVFWDMDHWIMPAVLPGDPEAARAMVDFRFRGLESAKKRAALFGYRGAMFPWEAGQDGSDVTPAQASTGWAEQHNIPEVALAAWEYYAATGDAVFLRNEGWPLVREIADWIASRGVFTARGFEILHVMGHNENGNGVDDDSHLNLLCKMALDAAVRSSRILDITAPPAWDKAAKAMYIPVDEHNGVILPFSPETLMRRFEGRIDRDQAVANAPVAGGYTINSTQLLFFHDPSVAPELYRRTWEYEESLRPKRPPEPSVPASVRAPGFTTPPLAAISAFFGDRQKALDLFHLAMTEYAVQPYWISKEYRAYRDGNYLMNQASLLLAAIYGFTGLRISDGDWRKYPASLPSTWTRIEMDRLWIRGKAYRLVAEHGKLPSLMPVSN